nr:uncharacterized protein LOC126545930 isoform X2 [Dermacentor andersoni]
MCWNEENGCEAVMAVSDMPIHFYEDCVHHPARCPKCSAFVLCSNMCVHRRSNCSSHSMQNKRVNEEPSVDSIQEAMLTALERILEGRVGEIRSRLDQATRDNNAHYDRLNQVSHILNTLRETVIQLAEKQIRAYHEGRITYVAAQSKRLDEVSQRMTNDIAEKVEAIAENAATKCLESLEQTNAKLRQYFTTDETLLKNVSQTVSAFEGILAKALERATETICVKCENNAVRIAASKANQTESGQKEPAVRKDHLLGHNTLNVTSYEFHVMGYNTLKREAISVGYVNNYCNAMYLCGYRISPGVSLKKNGSSVSVSALIELHKGVIDEFLHWPFNRIIKLTFIGQSKGEGQGRMEKELSEKTGRGLKFYGRPIERSNAPCRFNNSFDIYDLESGGYVEGNQLWVKFELLPPDQK